jgi:hypothetical protein
MVTRWEKRTKKNLCCPKFVPLLMPPRGLRRTSDVTSLMSMEKCSAKCHTGVQNVKNTKILVFDFHVIVVRKLQLTAMQRADHRSTLTLLILGEGTSWFKWF